jgi:MFS family permease
MCADLGAIVGPLVAGLLADTVGYPAAFAVGAALMLLGAGWSARMPREIPPAERSPRDPAPAE